VKGNRPSSPTVSVIVPVKNEAENLREVLPRLPQVHEVIVVDGNSVDDSVQVAREVLPSVVVVRQTRRGKGNALACGLLVASGDIVVMFDADGSADPAEIPAFVAALVEGADFAKGSRYAAGGASEDLTWLRSLGNSCLNMIANAAFGTRFTDLCYGYNAFWRDLVSVLDLPSVDFLEPAEGLLWGDGFEIETLISSRFAVAGVKTTEVPSVERSRLYGYTNLRTFRDGSRVLFTILAEHKRMRLLRKRSESARLSSVRPSARPRLDLIQLVPAYEDEHQAS
jgi:glycosyltransferase involved in cell wall biosynthesis